MTKLKKINYLIFVTLVPFGFLKWLNILHEEEKISFIPYLLILIWFLISYYNLILNKK